MAQTAMYLYVVIRAYGLTDGLTPNQYVGITNFVLGSVIIAFIGAPKWLSQRNKHAKFIQTSQKNQNIKEAWSEYIFMNADNFQRFQMHLINLKIFQNLLFLLELNQYKQAVLDKVNTMKKGYLLEFDDDIIKNTSGIGETELVQYIKRMDTDEITTEQIKQHMDHLFSKYFAPNNNTIFVTFMSSSDKITIEQRTQTLPDLQVLTIFDDMLRKTNNTIQLLYEEYVMFSSKY